MADILAIDLAWETINVLGELSRATLAELERLGGKAPVRSMENAASVRVALRKHASDSITGIISKSCRSSAAGTDYGGIQGAHRQGVDHSV
jgi:hypothetical protein